MKQFLLSFALICWSLNMFSQATADSLHAFFKGFDLSAEIGYNFLMLSSTDEYDFPEARYLFNPHYCVAPPWKSNFVSHQCDIAIAAESSISKWRLSVAYDYLHHETYPGAIFDANHLRVVLSLQFFILKRSKIHLLLGPSVECGWITRYDYTYNGASLHNPDIRQTVGVNVLCPLTALFPLDEHSRVYATVAGGLHLRHDHEFPNNSHWGGGLGPEAELVSYCPLSIGVGYGYAF